MIRHCLTTTSLLTLTSLLVAQPAFAADEAKVSWDGRTWADHIEGQLFELPTHWVPGDDAVGSFLVLNNSADPAAVTVELVGDDPSGILASDGFTVAIRFDDAGWTKVDRASRFTLESLPANAITEVEVRGSFEQAAGNTTQELSTDLTFRVVLEGRSEARAPAAGPPPGRPSTPPGPSPGLAVTGGAPLILLLAAAALTGTGLALRRTG